MQLVDHLPLCGKSVIGIVVSLPGNKAHPINHLEGAKDVDAPR